MRHAIPGNVRELENIIEYAFVLCHNGFIDVCHLPDDIDQRTAGDAAPTAPLPPLEKSEAEAIRSSLIRNRGHQVRTAEDLQIGRTTLWRKMKKYGLDASAFRRGTNVSVSEQ